MKLVCHPCLITPCDNSLLETQQWQPLNVIIVTHPLPFTERKELTGHIAYFSDLNVFYPILDEGEFRRKVEMFYLPDRSQLKALDYSLFFLAVSVGALSQNHGSHHLPSSERLSIDVYEQAWSMIQDAIASPSETSLQVLLLHASDALASASTPSTNVFLSLCGTSISDDAE